MSEILEINGLSVELIRKPIKNMHLRVYPPDGRILVSAPLKLPMSYIFDQLKERSPWILYQQNRLRTHALLNESAPDKQSLYYFQGEAFELEIHFGSHVPPAFLQDSVLHLYIKPQDNQALRQQTLVDNWYRDQMKIAVPPLLAHWENIIGVKVLEWGLRDMKTRWGSCNMRAQRIWLNLKLIKKPPACLEYVLVHELVHLLEPSHNKRFHAFMTHFLPNWRETKKILESSPS